MKDAGVETGGQADQVLQPRRQRLEIGGSGDRALRGEAHAVLLGLGLVRRDLPFGDGSLDEKPRRDLHQPGGQPHALACIGERALAGEHPRILAAGAVEIGRRLLDELHAFLEQRFERVGMDESAPEMDRVGRLFPEHHVRL